MRTLNLPDTNHFYAPADDECWIILAKEIMGSYSQQYANQIVYSAFSQEEYDRLDRQRCVPQRRSILRKVKHGPLKNIIDMPSVYHAFEIKRLENLRSLGIQWEDKYFENIEDL